MAKSNKDYKLAALSKVYTLFDEACRPFETVCRKRCAACCTCNVTMTGLEARFILSALSLDEQKLLSDRIMEKWPEKRYIPELTTNMFARFVMSGREIPDEQNDPSWGPCPVLKNDICTIYDVRPFGCRALMSQTSCETTGTAMIPPQVLTINNLFMQAIEHLDRNGIFGNFSDVLLNMLQALEKDRIKHKKDNAHHEGLLINETIGVLMIPPEHRQNLAGLIRQLSGLIQ